MAICAECGGESRTKFCSQKCENAYRRRGHKERQGKGCPVCGAETSKRQVYCSPEHAAFATKKNHLYRDDIVRYHLAGLSGEEISEKIGISARRIWDYISMYRYEGYLPKVEKSRKEKKEEKPEVKNKVEKVTGITLYIPKIQQWEMTREDVRDAERIRTCLSLLERESR